MPKFEIKVESPDIDAKYFREHYYDKREPVLIRNVPFDSEFVKSLTPEKVKTLLSGDNPDATQDLWWWNLDESFFEGKVTPPGFIKALKSQIRTMEFDKPDRFWASSNQTVSPWHHDGGSVEVFNLQLTGKKLFILIDPQIQLPCARYSGGSTKAYQPPVDSERYAEVELTAGDMIYIPRHWYHKVTSLTDWNLNLNYTWTDFDVPMNTPTSKRVLETIALFYYLHKFMDWLPEPVFKNARDKIKFKLTNYGRNSGYDLARKFAQSTNVFQLLARAMVEVTNPSVKELVRQSREEELKLNNGVPRAANDYWLKSKK